MVTGSFPGIKSGRGVTLTPHPYLVPWSWKSRAIPLTPPICRTACTESQCLSKGALYLYNYVWATREVRERKVWNLGRQKNLMIYFSLFPMVFPSTYNICYPLSSTCFRPHRPIIRRSKLYMQPMVFSPSADVFVARPLRKFFLNGRTTKTSAEGESTIGCMYNLDLLMMGLWGLKHVEERG